MKIQAKPTDLCIIQVYAPNEDADDNDKEKFYGELLLLLLA